MRKLGWVGAVLVTITCWTAAVGATTITIYTDKTEWRSALDEQYFTEDFADTLLNDGVSYVSTESGHINPEHECYQDVLASESQNEPMTIWSFEPQVIGYGGNWTLGGPGGSGNNLLVYIDDDSLYVGTIPNSYNGQFWGFVSDTPFTSVRLVGGPGTHQQHYCLDDMVYSPAPEPLDVEPSTLDPAAVQLSIHVQNPYGIDQAIRVTGNGADEAFVRIFDARGRLLRRLVATGGRSGEAVFSWDGRTASGQKVPVSALFMLVEGGGRTITSQKVVLMR